MIRRSALRRTLIVTVAVALTDLTVAAMDQEFSALILADLTGSVDGICLRAVGGGEAGTSCGSHSPFSVNGDNVLVSFHTGSWCNDLSFWTAISCIQLGVNQGQSVVPISAPNSSFTRIEN